MRSIFYDDIVLAVTNMCEACCRLTPDAEEALSKACERETSKLCRFALSTLVKNAAVAKEKCVPVCQDTGMAVFFLELGQDVRIEGGYLEDAINEGVRRGYKKFGCRMSVLDPLTRENTFDNTPAIIHTRITCGDKLKISFLPKGFGSENMSRLFMLNPSDGVEGVKASVIEAVKSAGSKPCPPIIVGVGIGGTSETAMLLAKKQLLRDIGSKNPNETLCKLELELKDEINALRIGAQGFGGDVTALDVFVDTFKTHIAALPVAVNIQCNAERKAVVIL